MMVADQEYAHQGSAALRYDAILPDAKPAPAVVCIHGGGWVSGDRSDMHEIARFFAENGYAAFCPQYRLAPLYPYPAAIEDIAAFFRYLRSESEHLGILPDAIGVIGNSAGGHLASMAGFSADADGRANAVVNISGLADLTNMRETHPPISWDFLGQFLAGAGPEDPQWIEASPIFRITSDAPPFLIFHGEEDDVVYPEQSKRLHEALLEAGVPSEMETLPGEGHSFTLDGFNHILRRSLAFFQERMQAGAKA